MPSHTALLKTNVRSAFLIQIWYPVIGVPLAFGAVHVSSTLFAMTDVTGATGVAGVVAQRMVALSVAKLEALYPNAF